MTKVNDSDKHVALLKSLNDAGVTDLDTLVASIVSKLPEKASVEPRALICNGDHWCIIHPD
jgi:hypothetical protein